MNVNDKNFYISFGTIKKCYPYAISTSVKNYGVLSKYENKKYTLHEINAIVAELIIKQPFISNSMSLKINIMNAIGGYHYILDIKNYGYESQERERSRD